MSAASLFRLRGIQDDYAIASSSLGYIVKNWHRQTVSDSVPFGLPRIRAAQTNLEMAHFLRLAAEFESILRDHLRTNHARVKFPARKADWKMDWFLSRVCQRESIVISPELRRRLDENRDYRNSLAHGLAAEDRVTFDAALRTYTALVRQLPEPFG